MVKIGIVGEDPNDTSSIINLLKQKYDGRVQFKTLARGVKGHQLSTDKLKRTVKTELKDKTYKFVVYARDLDDFATASHKVRKCEAWFQDLVTFTQCDGVLLINIWELEALILADIDAFNILYKVKHPFKGNPSMHKEPKETLKSLTLKSPRQFHESHCPEIFEKLNFDTVKSNCGYFREFIEAFEQKL